MLIWWMMLCSSILVPVLMAVIGFLFLKYQPKEITYLFGYRTKRSMKNMDTWIFAHKYFGRLSLIVGLIMFVPSIVPFIFLIDASELLISCIGCGMLVVQCIVLILTIIPVEKALKRNFDNNGEKIILKEKSND